MKMMLFLALCLSGALGWAQESDTSSASVGASSASLPSLENKKFQDNYTLTDAKLRVDDGSLSRYSFKSKIVYRGPTLGDFTAPDQPNPDGSVGNYSQAIKGTFTGRYRLDSTHAISMGTGYVLDHPFHGMDQSYAHDPTASYDIASRWNGFQFRNSPGLTVTTTPQNLATGQMGVFSFDNSIAYDLGNASKWSFTLDNNATWQVFNRAYRPGATKKGGDGSAQEYYLTSFPGMKYNFSDAVFSYSGLQLEWYNLRSTANKWSLLDSSAYVRTGIAYVIDREIYLTPYLDTYLPYIRTATTTLNFQTIFSVF